MIPAMARKRRAKPREENEVEFARIVAFSDGVFAIAITLLVLNFDIAGHLSEGELVSALWDQRVCRITGPEQLVIELPLRGHQPQPRFGLVVGELLTERWRHGELDGAVVGSVAGHCSVDHDQPRLTLLICFAGDGGDQHIDGEQMGRHVARALRDAHASTTGS